MPGQKNWIILLVGGAVSVAVGVLGLFAGGSGSVWVWLGFGVGLLVGSVVLRRRSRRFVQEAMAAAREDLERDAAR